MRVAGGQAGVPAWLWLRAVTVCQAAVGTRALVM
jgi:hypothetical protein